MMHAPSIAVPLSTPGGGSVSQGLPVSPAEQTWAHLLTAPSTPPLLRSQLQACALVILVPGFLGQQGALLTWLPPERMPWSELLPGDSLVVEDDSLEGTPQGVMALTHACFRAIPYFRRPQLLTRR
jgi:hypothetical protein